jgi:hypothetical protein
MAVVGHVFADAELSWKRSARVRVLVTGAMHSVLPAELADCLGVVRSPRPIRVELADGSHRSMRVGTVLVRRLKPNRARAVLLVRTRPARR